MIFKSKITELSVQFNVNITNAVHIKKKIVWCLHYSRMNWVTAVLVMLGPGAQVSLASPISGREEQVYCILVLKEYFTSHGFLGFYWLKNDFIGIYGNWFDKLNVISIQFLARLVIAIGTCFSINLPVAFHLVKWCNLLHYGVINVF